MQFLSFGIFVLSLVFVSVKTELTSCVQCNSAQDEICATNPDQFLAKSCSKPNSKCYSRIVDGKTVRGCSLDLDEKIINNCHTDCAICDYYEGCNNQIFPSHRTQCIQCKGGHNDTCAVDTFKTPVVCPIYKFGDRCIIRKSGNKDEFIRGCLSSYEDKCKDQKQCYLCEGHGCNKLKADSPDIPTAKDSAAWIVGNTVLMLILNVILLRS